MEKWEITGLSYWVGWEWNETNTKEVFFPFETIQSNPVSIFQDKINV